MRYFLILLPLLTACSPIYHVAPAPTLTTGLVQKELCIGMSGGEVAAVFGSPNIVSLDENRNEVWIYDKISTEVERCSTRNGVWLVVMGGGSSRCQSRTSQKTLTVIVKFDENNLVKDFTYHSSRF